MRKQWETLIVFFILVTLPTLWPIIFHPQTRLQEILGSMLASLLVGIIGWIFIKKQGWSIAKIGLHASAWRHSLVLFAIWWLAISLVGWLSSALNPNETWQPQLSLTLETVLGWALAWIFVAVGEEIAFRGFLQNAFSDVLKRPWAKLLLAAFFFSLWHLPANLFMGNFSVQSILNVLIVTLFSLVFFNLPYHFTGLLPLLILFHGWNDFPILLNGQAPNSIAAITAFLGLPLMLWLYIRWQEKQAEKNNSSADA